VSKNKSVVLCFHRVSDQEDFIFQPLQIQLFENLMKYVDKNFKVCTTEQFFDEKCKNVQPKILLTFDDGYKDFIENALPILHKRGMPAVHNIIVEAAETNLPPWTQRFNNIVNDLHLHRHFKKFNYEGFELNISESKKKTLKSYMKLYLHLLSVDKENRDAFFEILEKDLNEISDKNSMMNWDDLHQCISTNVEIGSHTYSHDSLISILEEEKLMFEIQKSKEKLASELGVNVNLISFPNGKYNNEIVDVTKKSGYKWMFTTKEVFYDIKKKDNYIVPRISIHHNNSFENIFKLYSFHNLIKGVK
jgi:peptidoglycan/xylan/chitin deacetylase (PgdA/CDA1 family)